MPRGRRIPIPLPNTGAALMRKRSTICFRSVLVFFLFGCVVLQVYILTGDEPNRHTHGRSTGGGSGGGYNEVQGLQVNDSVAAIMQNVPPGLHKFLTPKPKNLTRTGEPQNETTEQGVPPIEEIKRQIARYNEQQSVLNEETFGPLLDDSVIIVVQVHKRVSYLRHLIVSLAQARDIAKVLLIFSHDFYHEEINELVQSVDFCKVMQIYYPYSIQTHPNEFPGADPKDCDRNMKKEQAEIRRCNNYQNPDLYGHYREAKFTQTKHHWWWKANRVFDELDVTRYHTGPVIFLEEDHYVAEDFLYVLDLMEEKARSLCAKCNILSLGTYLKTFNYYSYNVNKVEITPWISSKHNMGMVFNKTTWHEIVGCAKQFCSYDDYNWDWSLQHVSQQCLQHKLHVMVLKGPRVFHIGECGVHHKKKNCESNHVISKVQKVLQVVQRSNQMFPKSLKVVMAAVQNKNTKLRKGNGGWGDKRDHSHCLNMTLTGRFNAAEEANAEGELTN